MYIYKTYLIKTVGGMDMKKMMAAGLSAYALTGVLFAGGDIAPQEVVEQQAMVCEPEETKESDFYVIVKGLTVSGDTVLHEENTFDGDRGYGFGIDLGYRLGSGFAIEYDFAHAENTVTETDVHHQSEEGDANYYSHALDLVYTYRLTDSFGIFAKGGYEYEIEEIDAFEIDEDDNGFNYGIGIEWAINEQYALVAEYEKSTIEGPRGDNIFAGVMYNF